MAETKTKAVPVKRAAKKQIASKQTMNLAFHESSINLKTLVPTIVVIVIAFVLFAKFGFLDPIAKKTAALMELSDRETQLSMINAKLTGYDEVANEYGRYSYGWMTENEAAMVERMEALSIVEKTIAPNGTIENFTLDGNTLTVTIDGLSLQQTSKLVNKLEDGPLVKKVYVYSAKAEDETLMAKVGMTITLEKGEN